MHGNISTSSVPLQWPNIDVGNQRPQIALSTATSLKGSQQIVQSKLLDHSILLDIGDSPISMVLYINSEHEVNFLIIGSMVGQHYNFNAVQPGNLNQLNPMCRVGSIGVKTAFSVLLLL